MKNKTTFILSAVLAFLMFFNFSVPSSFALGGKEAMSSLILPTTGQAMNGELGSTKTKVMAGVEAVAVTGVVLLGTLAGGGIVWLGTVPLVANHLWSATDAYKGARTKQDPILQEQMVEAHRNIDLSRQRRFEREQAYRSDIRERVQRAREQYDY